MGGMKRIWVNGCFDIIHYGHVRLLEHAASLGNLIVGLNSDDSYLNNRGHKPINSQIYRREMLLALKAVNAVVTFDEPTPVRAIRINMPIDIIVKGVEYRGTDFVELTVFPKIEYHYFDSGINIHSSDIVKNTYRSTPVPSCVCSPMMNKDILNPYNHDDNCLYKAWLIRTFR